MTIFQPAHRKDFPDATSSLSGLSIEADESLPVHPLVEARGQADDAIFEIRRDADDFLHFPWTDLNGVVGGIGPGEVWFVGAYSGHGKTTFLMSALDAWYEQGVSVYFMGLESRPQVLRTHWACKRLGIDAGEVLSGKLAERADRDFVRAQLAHEIKAQTEGERSEQIYFSPRQFVNVAGLKSAGFEANALGSDVLIIDHVDHIEGSGRGLYDQSVNATKTLLSIAQDMGLRVLAATQFNNEMIRGNRLGMHVPPQPTAVYMGNHKRQIATGMLGLYRPLKFEGLTKEENKKFMQGALEPQSVCEPNVMAVAVMKHRLFGNREGKKVYLRVDRGKVIDLPERDQPNQHAIRTARTL